MALFETINTEIKNAMLAHESAKLEALRSIKAAFLLAKTDGTNAELTSERELAILQKLYKQRKESAKIYSDNNRQELADKELFEASVIEQFLPKPPDNTEITRVINEIITNVGAKGMADMGKVMGATTKHFAGAVDGKVLSEMVKSILSKL